jgi:hypothetical protein
MPQPFPKHLKACQFHIGKAAVVERPQLCYLGMSVVIEYASLEVALSALFTRMLGANAGPAVAILSVIKNNNIRNEAFRAVADDTLTKENLEFLNAVLAACEVADKERNRIAHWIWAVERQLPDSVALIDPRKVATIQQHVGIMSGSSTKPSFDELAAIGEKIRDSALIYRAGDFEAAWNRINRAVVLCITLSIVVGHPSDHPEGAKARKILLDAPEIQQWLVGSRRT